MRDEILVRAIVGGTTLVLMALDIFLVWTGRASITSQCRWLNEKTQYLFALVLASIWVHLFIYPLVKRWLAWHTLIPQGK
jgi:hypothetical protein